MRLTRQVVILQTDAPEQYPPKYGAGFALAAVPIPRLRTVSFPLPAHAEFGPELTLLALLRRSRGTAHHQCCLNPVLFPGAVRIGRERLECVDKFSCQLIPMQAQSGERRMNDIAQFDVVKTHDREIARHGKPPAVNDAQSPIAVRSLAAIIAVSGARNSSSSAIAASPPLMR